MAEKRRTIDLTTAYDSIIDGRSEVLLSDSLKKQIQGFIDMLQKFYDEQIAPPTCTENDALEYIPLFCINGALIASMMNVTYDEYLLATDYMIRLLGLEEGYDDKEISDERSEESEA